MATAPLPSQDLKLELVSSTAKGAFKAAGATSTTNLQMVPLDKIEEIPGYNVRIETPDYKEHIESLAKSIVANGFYPNKPLAGYPGKDDKGDKIMLTDGYSRRRATIRANELLTAAGQPTIDALPLVLKSPTTTPEELMVALVQDNEGRQLTPMEKAIVVKRLESYLLTDEQIAEKFGCTVKYVQDLKLLVGAPAAIRTMVVNGKIAATEAVKQIKKNPVKAAETLAAAVKGAEAVGKSKATGKDVKAASGETSAKNSAPVSGGNLVSPGSKPAENPWGHKMRVRELSGGAQITFHTYRYKAGQIVAKSEVLPILYLNDQDFWEFNDDEKTEVRILYTLQVQIEVQHAVDPLAKPEAAAPAAAATQEGGEAPAALPAPAPEGEQPAGDKPDLAEGL